MAENTLSLFELNTQIKNVFIDNFPNHYWIKAEIASAKVNSNGHCFLELIEKDTSTDKIIAQARATIWAFTYRLIKPYFESTTGQSLDKGMKVLINVAVNYHEMYGLSLDIKDIDPTYTIGDLEQRKQEIVQKLTDEGVIYLNKELEIPLCPQRVAVISSSQAAGYEDFLNQIYSNNYSYNFSVKLFNAVMQGDRAEDSIINALDKINNDIDNFDIVVLIRGGGSQSDLNCYNSYLLAYNLAQFPIPVITGIGHDRDDTIADIVANTKLKTPTAVADFLIEKLVEFEGTIERLSLAIQKKAQTLLQKQNNKLSQFSYALNDVTKDYLHEQDITLQNLNNKLFNSSQSVMLNEHVKLRERLSTISQKIDVAFYYSRQQIKNISVNLNKNIDTYLLKNKHKLELAEQKVYLSNPDRIMEKGYSITFSNGNLVKSVSSVKNKDEITTVVRDGTFKSKVRGD